MATKKQVQKAARKVVMTTNRYANAAEGAGVVRAAAKQGSLDPWKYRYARKMVRREVGAKAAQQVVHAMHVIDNSPNKAGVARRTANRVANRVGDGSSAGVPHSSAMHKRGGTSYGG